MHTGKSFSFEMIETRKVWVFPKHRFFEYEAKDEEWCRKLGIGHEENQQYKVKIPNAYIREISLTPDGCAMSIGVCPSYLEI